MAYRFEGEDLIIDGWERGISDGPYSIFSPSALGPINQTGTVEISYANITGIPGEVSVQMPLIASTIAGSPPKTFSGAVQMTTDYVAHDFMMDQNGQVFTCDETLSTNTVTWTYRGHSGSNSITITNNGGCVWWQGYLFTFWSGKIYYSSDNGVTNTDWTGTVGSITNGPNYAISSKVSDTMYFCNGSSVGSLTLTPGATFDPTNASTYTFQQTAVNLPAYDTAGCLAELNGQILIGSKYLNRIYPWDANNLQGTGVTSLVGLPLFITDLGVQRIVAVNSNAYIFSGITENLGTRPASGRGYIYITNGSTIDIYKKMPDNFVTTSGGNSNISNPYWAFGDAIWHRNQLLFGARAIDNNSNTAISGTGGVWGIDVNSGSLYRANLMTSGGTSVYPIALQPFIINPGNSRIPGLGYMASGFDGSTTGYINNTSSLPTTSAVIVSDKIPVGTKLKPKTFEQLELKCAVALVSGESIDISVITDLDPSGFSVGSMTSTDGISKVFTPLSQSSSTTAQGIQWLQVKATLNPTSTNPTYVRLREIRLR